MLIRAFSLVNTIRWVLDFLSVFQKGETWQSKPAGIHRESFFPMKTGLVFTNTGPREPHPQPTLAPPPHLSELKPSRVTVRFCEHHLIEQSSSPRKHQSNEGWGGIDGGRGMEKRDSIDLSAIDW